MDVLISEQMSMKQAPSEPDDSIKLKEIEHYRDFKISKTGLIVLITSPMRLCFGVHLFVCFFLCVCDNSKTYKQIFMDICFINRV